MVLYLSIIFGAMIVLGALDIIFAVPIFSVSPWLFVWAIPVSVAFQFAIDGLFAFIFHLLPEKWFSGNKKCFAVSKREQRFYEKLGIRRWKDKIWELGKLGGFSKSKIASPNDPKYVERFLMESNKGICEHIVGMIAGFLVIFILPLKFAWIIGFPVALINALLNYPSVMILRYNIPKLQVLLKRTLRLSNSEQTIKAQNEDKVDKINIKNV